MNESKKMRIDYRYQNWGKTERIVCEQDDENKFRFVLLKQGQNVGTITKRAGLWEASNNNIFLPSDVQKIGELIDKHLAQLVKNPITNAILKH